MRFLFRTISTGPATAPSALRPITLRGLGAALALLLLTQCSAPIAVKHVEPAAPAAMAAAPSTTAGLLDTLRDCTRRLESGDASAADDYNFAVARLVEELERSGADPWSGPLAVPGCRGARTLRGRCPAGIDPVAEQLIVTDTLVFEGDVAGHSAEVAGLGAPVVAVKSFASIGFAQARKNQPLRGLTAVVRFSGTTATLELLDPYQVEEVEIAGRSRPLAANYSAPVMLGLSKARIDKLGLARLLHPSRYDDTAHLNFLQPYDPARIPVLFIHGFDSTPATFAPLYFELLQDDEIRRRYQFWAFSYPSGYPYPYSAMLLRDELDAVAREFPDRKNMVVVGHSMGSMISRLLVTDPGDQMWRDVFGKPVEETRMAGSSREILEKCIVFHRRPEVDRVIFYSGPHRGTTIASRPIARWASRLIRVPHFMADVRNTIMSAATADVASLQLARAPNSLATLSPNNAFVRKINEFPLSSEVPYHSVIGDRGKGDTPDSSDGFVPYWSSSLDGAASERIVPSGHSSHQHPEGIQEAVRILHLHLRDRS